MKHIDTTYLLLRIGVGFVFIYPPLAALFSQLTWLSYVPEYIRGLPLNEFVILHLIGIVQVIIGVWIISGRRIMYPSIAASIFLVILIVTNSNQFEVVFRDIAVLGATLTLAHIGYKTGSH